MKTILTTLALVALWLPGVPARARAIAPVPAASKASSVRFEANDGQFDPEVRFVARGNGSALYLTQTGWVAVTTAESAPRATDPSRAKLAALDLPESRSSAVRMTLDGARAARVEAEGELPGRTNYLRGRDPSSWHTDVRSYARVRFASVYDGVDLVYYGASGRLEYDFVVAPGADASRVAMRFEGADTVAVDAAGALVLGTPTGAVRHAAPSVYQPDGSRSRRVAGRFVLRGADEVGFELGDYDRTLPLVVDPVLGFSVLVGGGERDEAAGVATAGSSIYVTGYTRSTDFPVRGTTGTYAGGLTDAFVLKLDDATAEPVYATYIGGTFSDAAIGIEAAADGRVWVAGYTSSADFPVASAIDATSAGFDAFALELAPAGDALVYSTYLGGSGDDYGYGLAVDATGAAYVAGATSSTDFPTKNAFQSTLSSPPDGFVTKIAPNGASVVYSTFLGGEGADLCVGGVAVDAAGAAYVTGRTSSISFPVERPIHGYFGIGDDLFVAKLAPDGASLVYSTYLGGEFDDAGLSIAVDATGHAYVAGTTKSVSFPAKPAGTRHGTETDVFVVKLAADGTSVDYTVPIRTLVPEVAQGIAVADDGTAYVVGFCTSPEFPTKDPVQIPTEGTQDAYLATVDPTGASLVFSTKLGGRLQDQATAVAVDDAGRVVVVGSTASVDFPVAGETLTSLSGDEDVFVVRVDPGEGPVPPSVAKTKAAGAGKAFKVTLKGAGFAPGAAVYVGDDLVAWTPATVKATKVTLKGGAALAARFPEGVPVRVRVVNPDGGAAFASATR